MRQIGDLLFASAISLMVGCGFVPEKVLLTDARVVPLIQAATNFDRTVYGFTPIPTNGDVRLESRARARYDVMLHFYGETSRTIAFRKTQTGWEWIHEQETFTGPNLYTNVDGILREQIVLTYGIEPTSGHSPNQLHVDYFGEDARLASASNRHDLKLTQARLILEEWRLKKQTQ